MASKLDHDKPLPTLPKKHDAPKLTTLSVEARNHTRRFILRALEEEPSAIAGNARNPEKEAWADGILDALDSLGDGVANGGWIVGANRSRRASVQRKLALKDTKERTPTTDTVTEPKGTPAPDISEQASDILLPELPADMAMEQISLWVSKDLPPSPKPYAKHILLTIGAYGHTPDNIADFEFVPSTVGCAFVASRFMLPHPASSSKRPEHEEGIILYGLDEWDGQFSSSQSDAPAKSHCSAPSVHVEYSDKNPIKIVGGNFLLKGIASPAQHVAICKVLRLSIYIYLSVIIEQHLFSDSHVKLNIPKVRPRPAPLPVQDSSDRPRSPRAAERPPDRTPQGGVWGFLSKKTGGLLKRATSLTRRNSLDVGKTTKDAPRRSVDSPHPRSRRFSFLADTLPWQTKAAKETEEQTKDHPFRTIVTRIEGFQDLFSTTVGTHFPPPSLLRSLAEKEDTDPTRRLNPDELMRLRCLLGWEGRDAQGKGMVGARGFVRQQEFCILYSEHVLSAAVSRAPSVASTSSEASTVTSPPSSLASTPEQPSPVPIPTLCGGRRRWMRFRYYSREDGADKTLGGMITRMAATAEDKCGNAGCQSKRGQHELRFIHGGTRVIVNINPLEEVVDEERIDMWQSCVECSLKTETVKMSDGTL
jgi:1-phosphatidylinositol-3-phosphate 5-kinase